MRVTGETTEGSWTMGFACVCARCGAGYAVTEGESHYRWWKWTLSRCDKV